MWLFWALQMVHKEDNLLGKENLLKLSMKFFLVHDMVYTHINIWVHMHVTSLR